MKHKWYNEIVAWASGAEIECRHKIFNNADWEDVKDPMWLDDVEYRIKPQPKKPQYLRVFKVNNNIKFVEDGGYIEHNSDYVEYLGLIKLEVDDE